MFAHDDEYLTGMATVVLAVLMIVAMFWIRSHMPDDAAAAGDAHTATVANLNQATSLHGSDATSMLQPR